MSVPSFSDLGKNARDVFKTGYHYGKGLFKLNVKTRTNGDFEMTSDLSLNFDNSKLAGLMESKYKTREYGIFMEKWTTDGTLFIGYETTGKIIDGLALTTEFTYNPETSLKDIKFGAKFAKDNVNGSCALLNDFNRNLKILGAVVVAFKDIFLGYQGGYNTATNEMTKNDVGLAFNYRDVGFHFRCTSIPYEYGLSLVYKISGDWEAAVNGILAKSGGWQAWTMGAAAKYKLDENSILRFKFNTDSQLAYGLQQKLNEYITIMFSFNIDCANVTRGGHKVGLALELEA